MILRSLRAVTLILMAHALANCAAHAPGANTQTNNPDGAVTSSDVVMVTGNAVQAFCSTSCSRDAAAGCSIDGGVAGCTTTCEAVFTSYNNLCPTQFQAVATCASTATISCTSQSLTACSTQLSALASCVAMHTTTDAGMDGVDVIDPFDDLPDAMSPGVPSCSSICGRVSSASGCTTTIDSSCASGCAAIESVGADCPDQLNAFLECAYTSPIQCSTTTGITYTACTSQYLALGACIESDSGVPTEPDAGFPTDTGADPCPGYTTCATCIVASQCGWCNNQCYEGTATGPTGATCSSTWAWSSCTAM